MPKTTEDLKEVYWATLPNEELVPELVKRRKNFADMLTDGLLTRINRNWKYYHGIYTINDTGELAISKEGDEDATAIANINHFRSLIDQYVTYVVSNKPAWDSRALNTDFKSRDQAILFNDILDSYMEIGGVENDLRRAATHAVVLSAGFCYVWWNPGKGKPVRPANTDPTKGSLIYEGDLDFLTPTIFDVSWDYTITDFDDIPWIQVKTLRNKWDLLVLYPDKKDEILEAPCYGEMGANGDFEEFGEYGLKDELTDQIEVFEAWFAPTPSLPYGRHVSYIADKYALNEENEPNEYEILPVARIIPSEFILTCMGYTNAFDLQVPQEVYGANLSTMLTDLNTFAQPKIFVHEDGNINPEELEPGSGVPVLKGRIKPEVLDFKTQIKDLSQALEVAKIEMGLMAGIGPVSRGTPEGELKGASGAAFALLDSKSIQSTSVFGQRHREFISKVGTIALKIAKKKASTPRLAALAGSDNRSKLIQWSSDEIDQVDRVVVESGSPLQRSMAGKVQIADALREQGWLTTPQEYLTVIETGQYKPMMSAIEAQLSIIADENQRLRDNYEQVEQLLTAMPLAEMAGNMMLQQQISQILQQIGVVCLKTDNHILHIRRNLSILDSTEVRMIQGIVVPVTAHVQQHLDFMLDPEVQRQQLLQGFITGQQLQEFMMSMQIPVQNPMLGGAQVGSGNAPPGTLPGMLEGNPPPEETPMPMSETGETPKPPRVKPNAVNAMVASNVT